MNNEDASNPSDSEHRDAKDLVQGALLNYLGMAAKVSKVLFLFVAARLYGPQDLGLYLLAWSVVDIASKFGLWGLDRSIIRDIARYRRNDSPEVRATLSGILKFNLGLAIGLSTAATLGTFFLAPVIALNIFHDLALLRPIRILAFALPFVVLTQMLIATTKAQRIMKYEVIVRQGLEPLTLLLFTVGFLPFKLGAVGLVSAHVGASIVAVFGAAFVAYRKYNHVGWTKQPLSQEIKRETLRYTSPMALMDFLTLMVARMDILLIGYFLNSSAAGVYGIAVEVISVIKRVRQGFEPIFAPIVSELHYHNKKEQLHRDYVVVTRWLMAGTLLPVLAMILFPQQILGMFSKQAAHAGNVLVVLALSHGIFGIFSAAESVLVMTGKTVTNTVLAAGMLLVNTILTIIFIPMWGLVGAAVGMLAAHIFVSVARVLWVYRNYDLNPFGSALLWPLFTGSVIFLIFFLARFLVHIDSLLATVATLLLLLLTYITLFFVGAAEPEEKHLLGLLKEKLLRRTAILRA